MSKPMITGGMNAEQAILNLDKTPDKSRTTIDEYINTIKNAYKFIEYNYKNKLNIKPDYLKRINNITRLSQKSDYSDKNATLFAEKKYYGDKEDTNAGEVIEHSIVDESSVQSAADALPPPPTKVSDAAEEVTVQSPPLQQPDADINSRIRALIGEDAPQIDDFTPGSDTTTESYVDAINQRIDAAQAVHYKYPAPTQSQASDLKTAIEDSPVAGKHEFTLKNVEGGGKRKRRKQTKKKKHKRK